MPGDLPGGKYTVPLIGAWWPQAPWTLRTGASHWRAQQQQQEQHAQGLHRQWTQLAARNQGHTADDLISRLQQGEKHHLDLAEKFKVKAEAFDRGADAIDSLREGLRGIADEYNQRIASIENSKEPAIAKQAQIEQLIAEANGFAAHKSDAAVGTITDAIQKILTAEGNAMSPQEFLQSQGLNTRAGKPPAVGGTGFETGEQAGGGHGFRAVGSHGLDPKPGAPVSSQLGGDGLGQAGGAVGTGSPIGPPAGGVGGHMPGTPGVNAPGLPGGGGMPAAAGFNGPSPNSLGSSFAQGMMTGQPAGAGGQALSQGAMNAMGPSAAPPAQSPIMPAVGAPVASGALGAVHDSAEASASPVAATGGGGGVPVAPAVMTGGSFSAPAAPVAGGPAIPAGPLPAYGSDLRPPVVAPPAMSPVPTAPVSGAPVGPSAPLSPSAGGPLVSSPAERASSAAAGQAGAGGSALAGGSAVSATAGATAGAVSSRAAEQQRLQRLVDAVARQEPRLSWAAGLRDDGTTSLLVTDLAGGWIPPHVRLPANVTLLEPSARRRDASAVDLLGAVVTAAAHEPNGYVAEPGPDAPVLSGDRPARSAAPDIDELGPTLVDAVRRRDGLPRIAQAIAAPAVRKTGVLESEDEMLRGRIAAIQEAVLNAYPDHDLCALADWMLLAAIAAFIDEHEYLANYHMAWFAVTARHSAEHARKST
jgi:hypothetical protein